MTKIPILDYLTKVVNGENVDEFTTYQIYPTAISKTLGFQITDVASGEAKVSINADHEIHGNQQGTIHGGLLCELADAAIGTAHSTLMNEGESFTSIELKINFFRPTWKDKLTAHAKPIQSGKTITVYHCEISNTEGKLVAAVTSTVMTLRGDKAKGR
ncbi:PaaI family thioesterase [Chryseobacterium gleum]|uniref:PaaI family thioesterase n=1 Tax=Chryseobacterium gleum TaxID=250 RepID=UPI0031D2336F